MDPIRLVLSCPPPEACGKREAQSEGYGLQAAHCRLRVPKVVPATGSFLQSGPGPPLHSSALFDRRIRRVIRRARSPLRSARKSQLPRLLWLSQLPRHARHHPAGSIVGGSPPVEEVSEHHGPRSPAIHVLCSITRCCSCDVSEV